MSIWEAEARIRKYQEQKNDGGWAHTIKLSELAVVKSWGFRPSDFGICDPEQDLLFMSAHDMAQGIMTSYESMLERIRLDNLNK